ncbi:MULTISPECIES: hypothetical protein [Giesbergeria]|uniref:Uncharacterized protein n=1 Tax=Giesbergeria sinuosa TaxID=80883 RepID=A0ABV9QD23_9BURK
MAQLLALAMAYCDRTGASDKARADWRSDIQATSPGQREGLAAYLRGPLAKLVPTAPASTTWRKAAKPLPKFHRAQPWKAIDRAFQAHYWQCPDCKVAGRTGGPLCPQGQPLKDAVDQAFDAA